MKCPICDLEMNYSHENIFGDKIYYCPTHDKIEVENEFK